MNKNLLFFCAGLSLNFAAYCQEIIINEVQSSNISTIFDHTGNSPDWIELYNQGTTEVDLYNYGLSDNRSILHKWTFPSISIKPGEYLLIFASGLDLKRPPLCWETIIDKGAYWKYLIPTAEMPGDWSIIGFNDAEWQEGRSGFGYGDNDDSTTLNPTLSVFLRKKFTVLSPQNIEQAWLHIDYDDGFIAYLNGFEIARANVENNGTIPPIGQPAMGNHEAVMYQGLPPEAFLIDSVFKYLNTGENILGVRIFNQSIGSSDMTAIPFFSIGYNNAGVPTHQSPYLDIPRVDLHTNFKIDNIDDSLYLTNSGGIIIDSVQEVIPVNYSYGRRRDNSNIWAFYIEPTPGKENYTTPFEKKSLSDVQFSAAGGFQMGPVLLQLKSENPEDSIFYTLDGSEPGTSSTFYTNPFSINTNTIIRARVLKKGYLPGPISSQTYLFGVKHDLPIISLTTSPENLWNEDYGIYVMGKNASAEFPYFGANFWQDWERPASLTLYEPDGNMAFQVDGGIKIYGAYSRGNAQKSIAFHTRKVYGDDKISYKIFNDLEIDEFESLVLRNSGNDFNNTMMRDALCNAIVKDLELDQMAYRPAVAYLNGQYWGILNIREKVNEAFLASHHNVNPDNLDILEGNGSPITGSPDHYNAMMNYINNNSLNIDKNYNHVKGQMDVDNFIKYQVAQIFIDNRDWPGNNVKFWRERSPSGKWRWILFDLDFGFNTWSNDNQNFNTLAFALDPNGPGWPNPPWSTLLLRRLMENQSFKYDFINCFADNLNTIFEPQRLLETIDKLKSAIDTEIPRHMDRWGGNINYRNDRLEAMRQFARARQTVLRQHIRTQFNISGVYSLNIDVTGQGSVRVNSVVPNHFPWSGIYFNGIPINVRAIPGPGYRFVRWEGTLQQHNELLTLTEISNQQIKAVFEPTSANADDIVINEINYNSSETFKVGDWLELLNISEQDINISGWRLMDGSQNEFIFPLSTIIERGDFLVVCRNLKDFRNHFPEVKIIQKEMEFGLSSGGDCIELLSSDGRQIDKVCYSNYTPWPLEPNGGGSTLSLVDAHASNNIAENWAASMSHGTPGARNNMITGFTENYESGIVLYPNPAKDIFNVIINASENYTLNGFITDMSGRQTPIVESIPVHEGKNEFTLKLDSYKLGVYIVTLIAGERIIRSKLIII